MLTIKNVGKLLNNTFKDKTGMEWYVDKIISDPTEYLIVVEQRYGFKKEIVSLRRELDKEIDDRYLVGISNGGKYNQREYKNKMYIVKGLIEDRSLFIKRLEDLINDIVTKQ